MRLHTTWTAVVAVAFLTGCGLDGLQKVPAVSQVNLKTVGKLEFAVGTANVGFEGNKTELNVVTSFRQANGDSAVLLDTPTITGPSGFTNTADNGDPDGTGCPQDIFHAGADSGKATISGTLQNPNPTNTPLPATFSQSGGVFAYGIEPINATEANDSVETVFLGYGTLNRQFCAQQYPAYPTPIYFGSPYAGSTNPTSVDPYAALATKYGIQFVPVYLGGPPAYPFFNDGSFPSGFAGYSQGFTTFDLAPVAGQYSLSVNIQAANASGATVATTATLGSLTPLANEPAPTWTSDGAGGGTATVAVPNDSRIAETMVYFYVESSGLYFSAGPQTGYGTTLSFTLPDNDGPCTSGVGCTGSTSITSGSTVLVYAASFDYPMFEASPPGSTTQTPTITGANGQADVTFSGLTLGTE